MRTKKDKIIDALAAVALVVGLIVMTIYMAWNLPEHLTTWR